MPPGTQKAISDLSATWSAHVACALIITHDSLLRRIWHYMRGIFKNGPWVMDQRGDQSFLQNAIHQHSNAIISRWKKKSHARRVELLQHAFPDIERRKFGIMHMYFDVAQPAITQYKIMHHFLSVEDLASDPMRLLSLLHARAEFDSDTWAAFDLKHTRGGWHRGAFDSGFSDLAIIAHGDRYGEVDLWNQEQADQGHIMPFQRAYLVVDAQAKLMNFLRLVVESLIVDTKNEEGPTKWLELIKSGFRRSNKGEICSSLIDQAFRPPPTFDIANLLQIANARAANAQDQVWLLQTEPSEMHNQYRILGDSAYLTDYDPETRRRKAKYDAISNMLSAKPTPRVSERGNVVEECQYLKEKADESMGLIRLGRPLPRNFNEALGTLEVLLEHILYCRSFELAALLRRGRAFERWYTRDRLHLRSGMIVPPAESDDPFAELQREDPLFWCILILISLPPGPGSTSYGMFDAPFCLPFFNI